MNGTFWMLVFVTPKVFQFSRKKIEFYKIISKQCFELPPLSGTYIFKKTQTWTKSLHDHKFKHNFKKPLIAFALVDKKLTIPVISYSTAPLFKQSHNFPEQNK